MDKLLEMKKFLKNALFSGLLISGIIGGGVVTIRLESHNEEYKKIKTADENVISRLKKIRVAQKKYLEVNNSYANTWDTLINFINTGKIPILQKTETITTVNGKDKVTITVDTLNVISAFEAINEEVLLTKTEIKYLPLTPFSNDTFSLYTSYRSGENFIEVKDTNPVNPKRQKGGVLKPLRFGSRAAATVKGNWE